MYKVKQSSKYAAIHYWVSSRLGKPLKCEKCGVENLRIRQYHWSNKDHKYKRKKEDWQRLCISCHRKHDKTLANILRRCFFCGRRFKTADSRKNFCNKSHWGKFNRRDKKQTKYKPIWIC